MKRPDPTLVLWNDEMRERAIAWIKAAPKESRFVLKAPKRTLPQNDKLHAMLTDIARQHDHFSLKLSLTDWKRLFVAAWRNELRLIPNLTGDGVVQVGERTSELTIAECADLIEFLYAWGAQNNIVWSEPLDRDITAASPPPQGGGDRETPPSPNPPGGVSHPHSARAA